MQYPEIPKQILEIMWHLGITDGDITPGYVRELVNLELDRPGELRPRKQWTSTDFPDGAGCGKYCGMQMHDPSGSVTWGGNGVIELENDGSNLIINLHGYTPALSETICASVSGEYDLVDIDECFIEDVDGRFYIFVYGGAKQDEDNWAYSVYILSYVSGHDIISAAAIDTTDITYDELDGSTIYGERLVNASEADLDVGEFLYSVSDEWMVTSLKKDAPSLGSEYSDASEDVVLVLGFIESERVSDYVEDLVGGQIDYLEASERLEYRIQAVFRDGALSGLSEGVVNGTCSAARGRISLNLFVSKSYLSANTDISAIRIFRRINGKTEGLDWELARTIDLTEDAVNESIGSQSYTMTADGSQLLRAGSGSIGHYNSGSTLITDEDDGYRSHFEYMGWQAAEGADFAGQEYFKYIPLHRYSESDLTHKPCANAVWKGDRSVTIRGVCGGYLPKIGYYNYDYYGCSNADTIISYIPISNFQQRRKSEDDLYVILGAISTGMYLYGHSEGETQNANFKSLVHRMWKEPGRDMGSFGSYYYPKIDMTVSATTYGSAWCERTFEAALYPYYIDQMLFLGDGQYPGVAFTPHGALGYDDMVTTGDLVLNSPRLGISDPLIPSIEVIADDTTNVISDTYHIHANRLLALGGTTETVEGGLDHYGSRLFFSEYGNFSDWRGNFIELGQKDAGSKVAVKSFKSIIVCFFTGAVHFIDASGGASSSWRILGGHLADGCLSKRHIVETPFGIAWCGKHGVYLFDGTKVVDLTVNKIESRYTSKVGGLPSIKMLAYNNIKKQLWVVEDYSDGTNVLVYDFVGGAWHTHELGTAELTDVYEMFFFDGADGEEYYSNVSTLGIRVGSSEAGSILWEIDSGPNAIGRQGIVKKIKKIYFSSTYAGEITIGATASSDIAATVATDTEAVVSGSNKIRTRGKGAFIILHAYGEFHADESIDSIEISYKPKKIK